MSFQRMIIPRPLLLTLALLATLASGLSVGADTATVTIEKAWARATPPGVPVGAGYMTIRNRGKDNDQLIAVSSPAAGAVQVHQSLMVNGEAQMREQKALLVPAGGSLVLEPGGYHLMLLDLTAPLVAGKRVPVTLQFEKSGAVTAQLVVDKAGSPAPDQD
ncbi:MAG: copper chaperone PCu(A)C [Gammaproteobacteria bacterium]